MNSKNPVELCKEKGYVAFGYVSPPLSTNSEYPEYIKREVQKCIAKVQKHQNNHTVSFGFMTDIHYSHTPNHIVRTKRLMNAYKEIAENTGISMLVLGGDHVNDGTKEYKEENYRKLRDYFCGINYFPINGNHDDNSIWDRFVQNEKSCNHITTQELHALFFDHIETACGNDGLYYMKDDPYAKIRYIFLDSNDIPIRYSPSGQLIYRKQDDFALSQRQTDWLVHKALKFDEDGWSVVIFTHFIPYPNGGNTEANELIFLNEILRSYKEQQDIHQTFNSGDFAVRVDADFSQYKTGNLSLILAGHTHQDILQFDSAGIPFIYRANAMMYETTQEKRIDGTASELLFDIVTIDTKENKIYIDRVGAGKDLKIPTC